DRLRRILALFQRTGRDFEQERIVSLKMNRYAELTDQHHAPSGGVDQQQRHRLAAIKDFPRKAVGFALVTCVVEGDATQMAPGFRQRLVGDDVDPRAAKLAHAASVRSQTWLSWKAAPPWGATASAPVRTLMPSPSRWALLGQIPSATRTPGF